MANVKRKNSKTRRPDNGVFSKAELESFVDVLSVENENLSDDLEKTKARYDALIREASPVAPSAFCFDGEDIQVLIRQEGKGLTAHRLKRAAAEYLRNQLNVALSFQAQLNILHGRAKTVGNIDAIYEPRAQIARAVEAR